jgi:hypothetical protein
MLDVHANIERIYELVGRSRGPVFAERAIARGPWPDLDLPLLHKVMDHIEQHPDEHNQSVWASRRPADQADAHCGTAFCFAGHAVNLSPQGYRFVWEPLIDGSGSLALDVRQPGGGKQRVSDHAADLLGLTVDEADILFAGQNLRPQLRYMVTALELAEGCRLALRDGQAEPVAPNEYNTECPHCYGTGKQGSDPCGPCGGKGWF